MLLTAVADVHTSVALAEGVFTCLLILLARINITDPDSS
jgi:hypothetical protein